MDQYPRKSNVIQFYHDRKLLKYTYRKAGREYWEPRESLMWYLYPFQYYVKHKILLDESYKSIADFRIYSYFHKFSLLTTLITYPYYRIFFEYSYHHFGKKFHRFIKPEFLQIKIAIKKIKIGPLIISG